MGNENAQTQQTAKRKTLVSVVFNCFLAVTIICENAQFVNPLHLDERGCRVYQIYQQLLKAKNLTTPEVCERTGIARSTIWRWEHGDIELKPSTLKKIADVFGVPLITFFMNEGVANDNGS